MTVSWIYITTVRHFQPSFFSFSLLNPPNGTILFNESVSYFHIFFWSLSHNVIQWSKGNSPMVKQLKKVTCASYLALIANPSGDKAHLPSMMKFWWVRSYGSHAQISQQQWVDEYNSCASLENVFLAAYLPILNYYITSVSCSNCSLSLEGCISDIPKEPNAAPSPTLHTLLFMGVFIDDCLLQQETTLTRVIGNTDLRVLTQEFRGIFDIVTI